VPAKSAAMQRAYIEEVGAPLQFLVQLRPIRRHAIYEAPDNVSMAAVVLAITSGGAITLVETTVLMSVE
jgi:uncharacterized protein with GYD domain